MIVTIQEGLLTVEDGPSIPGDESGNLALMVALSWAMARIAESAADAVEAASKETNTVH